MAPARRIHLDRVGSTNICALSRAEQGEAGPLWVSADEQSNGRGRSGRTWISARGNLYASLLLLDPAPVARLPELPFVASLALCDAIERIAGRTGLIGLKWPNDLLIDGAKLSGILLESRPLADGARAVVAGFGVNCRHCPDIADYPVTCLAEHGVDASPEDVLAALAEEMTGRLAQWDAGRGFSVIRQAWIDRALGVGEAMSARLSDRIVRGRFVDLDEHGCLILETEESGRTTIAAADVFFDRTPGSAH